jgi:hypothetical protein
MFRWHSPLPCSAGMFRWRNPLAGSAGMCGRQSTSRPVTAMHRRTPLAPIDRVVQAQATIMTYLDIFWLLGVLALCLRPLALFLPQMPRRAAPAH